MDKWIVEGYVSKGKKFFAQCKDRAEADDLAEEMASTYRGFSFTVTDGQDIFVEFLHND